MHVWGIDDRERDLTGLQNSMCSGRLEWKLFQESVQENLQELENKDAEEQARSHAAAPAIRARSFGTTGLLRNSCTHSK